jgi:hypothetical protein
MCPCNANAREIEKEDVTTEMTPAAWMYAKSMFNDTDVSCQAISDRVFESYGVKRSRQQWQRWRSQGATLSMPLQRGRPTKLPPAAEVKIIEAVKSLRSRRIHVAPMHLAMLAHQISREAAEKAGVDAPCGFTRDWVSSFLHRNEKDLGTATLEVIEDLRVQSCTSRKLHLHFRNLQGALIDLGWASVNPRFNPDLPYNPADKCNTDCAPIFIDGVKAHRIVSMDETRFTLNQAKEGKVTNGTRKTVVVKSESATGAPQDWGEVAMNKSDCDCTIVGGSTAGGCGLPALYIFKGAFDPTRDLDGGPKTRRVDGVALECFGCCNDKGSMTDDVMLMWLNRVLLPMFPDVSPANPVLLICDGYGSHLYLNFLERASDLGVLVFLRPPHTSHVTQGEDVRQGHFHTFHKLERDAKMQLKGHLIAHPRRGENNKANCQLVRSDIMRITAKAWEEAFSHEVCIKSWQATGVFPIFNRKPYWEIKTKEEARVPY